MDAQIPVLWKTIFSGRSPEEQPFRNESWEIFILPHELIMQEDEFNCLQTAAKKAGDYSLIVSAADGELPAVVGEQYEDLLCLVGNPVAMDLAYIFGASGDWGMVCTDGDFSMLGGVGAFMDEYASKSGGRRHLKQQFLDWTCSAGWFVSSDVTRKLLAVAGWDNTSHSKAGP